MRNTLHYGDCLNVMKEMPNSCVDLIYLDPPFNSKSDYNIFFPNTENISGAPLAQIIAFHDTWVWDEKAMERVERIKNAVAHPARKAIVGMETMLGQTGALAYLSYMAERLPEMKRLLKLTGSIYLHCDPTMSHYLKVIMDSIFGHGNYRNEIIWKRKQEKHNLASKRLGAMHDSILWYAHPSHKYQKIYQSYDDEYVKKHYKYRDERGRYATFPCTNERGGNKKYEFMGIMRAWRFSLENMERLHRENLLTQASPKSPFRYKKYLREAKGVPLDDLWLDIKATRENESLGYPTQKPAALLKRIIQASCPKDGIVLDPFCGCGTTIEAAHKLNRAWVGIDISPFAIDLIEKRRMKSIPVKVRGVPQDLPGARKLARENPFDFEKWAICRISGMIPNAKQVGDRGIDGRGILLNEPNEHDSKMVLAQIKGGKFNRSQLRDFFHVMERENAAMGIYITLDPITSSDARAEAMSSGNISVGAFQYPRVQLWSIRDYFGDKMPNMPPLADPYTGKAMQASLSF